MEDGFGGKADIRGRTFFQSELYFAPISLLMRSCTCCFQIDNNKTTHIRWLVLCAPKLYALFFIKV